MASSARIDELKKKFDENPRRYFAPLANEFRKGGDLDQAILICEEFLPQQPGHMSGHIVYGQALFENGRLDEARTVFETALSLDPENLIALRHLGDIAGRQGDHSAARRWYERVLEADPRNEELQSLIAGLDDGRHAQSAASASAEPERAPWREEAAPAYDAGHYAASSQPEPDLIDLDLTMPHGVPVVADQHVSAHSSEAVGAHHDEEPFEALSLGGIVPMPESVELMPAVEDRAHGFEATEFSAPEAPVEQAAGLQSAFEDETGIYGAAVQPLAGLDAPSHDMGARETSGGDLPLLDEDEGLVTPPHGDPVVASANTPDGNGSVSDFGALESEFEMPSSHSASERSGETHTSQPMDRMGETHTAQPMDRMSETHTAQPQDRSEFEIPEDSSSQAFDDDSAVADASPAGSALPLELPPEVIAAEAELIDTGMSMEQASSDYSEAEVNGASEDGESADSEVSFLDTEEPSPEPIGAIIADVDELEVIETAPATHQPFVTETMAELYLKQGFRDQALAVYQQLADAAPDDARLRDRVAELQPELPMMETGPTVREFFARLAGLRPGERSAAAVPPSNDDFAAFDAVPAPQPEPVAEVASAPAAPAAPPAPPAPRTSGAVPMSTGTERGAAAQGGAPPGGTIDALFGNRGVGTSEDSAASALAQAFSGSMPVVPAISGRPARAAAGELSLDSVFRDGSARPPRTSQSFSFDQFFSESAATESAPAPSAPRPTPVETAAQGEPAERGADDIQQFNSWLQGLKQK
jgi:tetratricopeptide (TPR) repeat protein